MSKCKVDKEVVCHQCGRKGHLRCACKGSRKASQPTSPQGTNQGNRTVYQVGEEEDGSDSAGSPLYHVRSSAVHPSPPIKFQVKLDKCLVGMEVDTGAAVSIMPETTFRQLWPNRELLPSQIRLQAYTKVPIPVIGCCIVNVGYEGQSAEMPLVIVAGTGPALLGRDWLGQIRLNWHQIHHVYNSSLQSLLAQHSAVFEEGLGTLQGYQAKIYVDPDAIPRFHRARSVPYALRDMVEKELQQLLQEGTLEPVEIAEWAAPIVVVLKHDKSAVRICSDFSVTVNPVSKLDQYPIPKVSDLFAQLGQGKYFSTLDLSHAYQQLPLEAESRKFVVINTHKGLFCYTQLPFGISSAPGIFQRVIESLLQGIEGVIAYLDDILITGNSEEAHLKALEEVLSRLERAGLRVKRSKCTFMCPSVTYLGHKIDAEGLHNLADRVTALVDAPAPTSMGRLKSYLGMLSYYSKFLPNLSSTLHPLY